MSFPNLIGKNILNKTFVQDPKSEWVKIDGVAIGESPQFGYITLKNNSIGNLLDQLALDKKAIVVVYNWKTGKAYVKTGFNLAIPKDSKIANEFTSFVFKSRVTKNMVPSQPQPPLNLNKKLCTPFVDVCLWPPFNMVECAKKTGNKFFSLAFIIADSQNNPSFGGGYPLTSKWYLDQITQLRAIGGDVVISFGGAAGIEIATITPDINVLVSKYQSVIDTYSCKIISFDIEGAPIADKKTNDKRNKAIAILQKNNPSLKVNYVLPVMPYGLDHHGIELVKNAKENKVNIHSVELMTMDYGQRNQQMGKAAISACEKTKAQLVSIGYLNTNIVIIPMIGKNDTENEMFTLENAKEVLTFAKNTNYIYSTSFWSMNRDKYQQNDGQGPLYANSGVKQDQFGFLNIFNS